MDLGRAFSYAFEDEEWTTKLGITAVIGIIPIINLAVLGWALDLIKNMLNGVEKPMPDWSDLGSQFTGRWVAGLMAAIAFFIYYLPWIIVEAILNAVANGMFGSGNLGAVVTMVTIAGCGIAILGAIYAAVIWLPYSVALMRYSSTREFNHFFQFSRNIELARQNLSILIILAVLVFVARILLSILFFIPCIGWLLALFSITIFAVVIGHLVGQAALEIAKKTRGSAA